MSITNTLRNELATRLMLNATEKHATAIAAQIKGVVKQLEEAHRNYLLQLMPEVPPSRYSALIQAGVLACTASGADSVYFPSRNSEGVLSSDSEEVAEGTVGVIAETDARVLLELAKRHPAWSGVFEVFSMTGFTWKLKVFVDPKLSCTLPDFRLRKYVPLTALEMENTGKYESVDLDYIMAVAPLFYEAKAVGERLAEVLREGWNYREDVLTLIYSCRTRKQLENLLPEAAALLPPLPQKRQDLAPLELAENVRKRLKEGVPV